MTKKRPKVLAINGTRQATLARATTTTVLFRFGEGEAPAHQQWCNASMPNAQPGYRWPHLATPPRG